MCSSAGAVISALLVAGKLKGLCRGRLMLAGLVGFGILLIAFSFSRSFWSSVVALIAVGLGQQVYSTTNNSLIQTYVDEEYRGRILSTLAPNVGMAPLGPLLAGLGTEVFGVQATIGAMAVVLVLIATLVEYFAHAARDLP